MRRPAGAGRAAALALAAACAVAGCYATHGREPGDEGERDAAGRDTLPDAGDDSVGADDARPDDDAGPDDGPGIDDAGPPDDGRDVPDADPLRDTDGDTIPDAVETWEDADGDTVPNAVDDDSDGDGLPDGLEAVDSDLMTPPPDFDRDGLPDFLDDDSDADTIRDSEEWLWDPDGDTIPAYRDADSDDDGLWDVDEAGDADPATPPVDSDGDTTPDYLDVDSDDDTIADGDEGWADPDGDTIPACLDLDSDDDTLPDAEEAGDGDLATDPVWCCCTSCGPAFLNPEADGDGLLDREEVDVFHTDPCHLDTDRDGAADHVELALGADPLDPAGDPRCYGHVGDLDPFPPEPTIVGVTVPVDPAAPGEPVQVSLRIVDDPADAVDATVRFVDRVEALRATIATFDPGPDCGDAERLCSTDLEVEDSDHDTIPDRFPAVLPDRSVCFRVTRRRDSWYERRCSSAVYPVTLRILAGSRVVVERPLAYVTVPAP